MAGAALFISGRYAKRLPQSKYDKPSGTQLAATCDITVRFHEPPADLAPFFTTFYRADFHVPDGPVSDALQPEWGGVRMFSGTPPRATIGDCAVISSDIQAQGPTTQPIVFEMANCSLWGFGLLPLGWATFMGVPAHDYANRIFDGRTEPAFARFAPLADRLTADIARQDAEYRAIVDFFRSEIECHTADRDRILSIHQMLLDPDVTDVASMAVSAGLSQRTLERVSLRAFGFPPKQLLRRQRFMRSLAQFMIDPSKGWLDAMDETYFDQSQFVRDCHDFLGMAPTDYAAMNHPVMSAFMRERMKALGSPVQTLDQPG